MKYCEKCKKEWPSHNVVCPQCHGALVNVKHSTLPSQEEAQEYAKRKKVWIYLLILGGFIALTSVAAQWRTSLVSFFIAICVMWDISDFKKKVTSSFKTRSFLIASIIEGLITLLLTVYFVITLYF